MSVSLSKVTALEIGTLVGKIVSKTAVFPSQTPQPVYTGEMTKSLPARGELAFKRQRKCG